MKINRTFTMDLSTIEMLKGKSNKSKIVNLAVRKYMNNEDSFSLDDITTRQLMACLQQRDDCVQHVKVILWDQLTSS